MNFDGSPVDSAQIEAATKTISHRGPDNLSVWTHDCVALGHTRLSIVDLSSNANQPFHLDQHNLSMVYNGEIYNYKELRAELESRGATFSTSSDTEVIIQGYAVFGLEYFTRLNGIFAVAIWDRDARELILARDRLGVKPLYLCRQEQRLIFGSEIKAILAATPNSCLLYTSPSPRDQRGSRMPSSA